jgi:hypothetical protein
MSLDAEIRELISQQQGLETKRMDVKRRHEQGMETQQNIFNTFQQRLDDAMYELSRGLDNETAGEVSNKFQDLMWDVKSTHDKAQFAREDDYDLKISELRRQERQIEDDMFTVRRKYS